MPHLRYEDGAFLPRQNGILSKIKKALRKEKFTTMGTAQFYWENENKVRVYTISMSFLLGDKGNKKVKMTERKNIRYSYLNHPFYHEWGVPWVESTGWAATDDVDHLQQWINHICGYNKDHTTKSESKESKRPPTKTNGNVVSIDFKRK